MTTPPTEQQPDEIETCANAATPGPWGIYEYGTDGSVTDVTAEVRRLRAELERRTEDVAFLERTTLPELRREIEHHKDGKQRWRGRAEKAESALDRIREIASRLAAHAVGFGDVPDESDRGPWGRTVGADIAELSAAAAPKTASEATSAPLRPSQGPEVPTEGETAARAAEGAPSDSGLSVGTEGGNA